MSKYLVTAGSLFLLLVSAFGQEKPERPSHADRVLVLFRSDSKQSKAVAQYYAQARGIPAGNVCGISGIGDKEETGDWLPYEQFQSKFLKKYAECLKRVGESKVLYVVLTYGMPYHLGGVPSGYGEAVDSYLAAPFETRQGTRSNNPYFIDNDAKGAHYTQFESLEKFRAKHPEQFVYSVWRLDGRDGKAAEALVDRALAAEKKGTQGQACFDRKYGDIKQVDSRGGGLGDWRLLRAAEFARAAGLRVLEDDHGEEFGTAPAPLRCSSALLYAGWYSYGHYNDAFDWAEGAVGVHLDSASCSSPRTGTSWCANALQKGITVTSGAVSEPYLEGLVLPDGMALNLLQGANVGDAFLRNTRWLRWMIVNIGDPLYTPFPGGRGQFAARK